jgi:hypothetical protein
MYADGQVLPLELPDPQDKRAYTHALSERLDDVLGTPFCKLSRNHVQLLVLALGEHEPCS